MIPCSLTFITGCTDAAVLNTLTCCALWSRTISVYCPPYNRVAKGGHAAEDLLQSALVEVLAMLFVSCRIEVPEDYV
jgi:hypothetical protein